MNQASEKVVKPRTADKQGSFFSRYFEISRFNTNIRTELLAGVSTYLSLAYIFIVNPAILSKAGMDVSAVLFATVVASGLSTLIMGLWARLPFALAPGLEMNGFFAFVVVGTLGLSWQQALGAVFWSGILCIFFTLIPARQKIIDSIPDGLKTNIAVSVGVFVATIGLSLSGLVVFDKGIPQAIGSLTSTKAIALYLGLIVCVVLGLKRLRFPGGMLVAIVLVTIFCKTQGIAVALPAQVSSKMFDAVFQLDLLVIVREPLRVLPVFLVLFLIDFYGSIGKFIGLTKSTNLTTKDGNLIRIEKAMYVDGIGTVGGALVGTSSIITYVESAVGIAAGGRTGITAIVCALLMLGSLAFTPLVGLVPVEATAGVLVFVGWLLLPWNQPKETDESSWRDFFGRFDLIVAVTMGLISFLTFSLDKAMLIGFLCYAVRQVVSKKDKPNLYLIGSTLLLLISVVSQYWF